MNASCSAIGRVVQDVGHEHRDLAVVRDGEHVEVDRVVDSGASGHDLLDAPLLDCRLVAAARTGRLGGLGLRLSLGDCLGLGLGLLGGCDLALGGLGDRFVDLEEVGDRDLLVKTERIGEPRQAGHDELGFGGLGDGVGGRCRLGHSFRLERRFGRLFGLGRCLRLGFALGRLGFGFLDRLRGLDLLGGLGAPRTSSADSTTSGASP